MSDLPAVGLAFLLGARHGAGPDHLAAVAALATRGGSRWGALRLAARFAAGHSIVLLLATAALGALEVGGIAPLWLGRVGEILSGAMLVLLGLATLRPGQGYLHSHLHAHEGGEVHAHPHAHEGRDHGRHAHAHGAAALGGAFALAGLPSHLQNVAPVLVATGAVARAACVGAFAAGILATMVAFGAAAGAARSRRPAPYARAASFAAVGVGAVWVAVRLFE
ncbi:MAG TPA: hypothetical protein VFI25_17625 [Planctomycetota bacterium]|nr:hypothetical protein [Planctomycetota bacterium]